MAFVKDKPEMESVTGEIFLIWTNVARRNVAWKKCHSDGWHLLKMVAGSYLSSLVKIGSVIAEILLTLNFCGGWVVVVLNHFQVNPN